MAWVGTRWAVSFGGGRSAPEPPARRLKLGAGARRSGPEPHASSPTPGFQRTVARPSFSRTSALATPATPWIASVTCRAQLLQVMPLTANSETEHSPAAGSAG